MGGVKAAAAWPVPAGPEPLFPGGQFWLNIESVNSSAPGPQREDNLPQERAKEGLVGWGWGSLLSERWD